ncbi:Diacylglycerol acyltransferase [Dillenia turbinata]|uniref:Diacylglycerol acyltransferase n=1 Tax=Dillenia turbinata TaxID=194707 RepID=A0AAN8Z6Q2_9MAGN
MVVAGACLATYSPFLISHRRCLTSPSPTSRELLLVRATIRRSAAVSTDGVSTSISSEEGRLVNGNGYVADAIPTKRISEELEDTKKKEMENQRLCLKDFFDRANDMIKPDGGPPRWFSPIECGPPLANSPLLLYLPDSLMIFNVWCLHIPVMDRTPFTDLVQLVERTIRFENCRYPNRPIYLVGESVGGCLALAVAARNPDIDLVLILANPATSFNKSQLQPLIPLLELMPNELHFGIPLTLSLMTGNPLRMVLELAGKGLPLEQTIGELSEGLASLSSYLPVLAGILPKETLLWKLQLIQSAFSFSNSRLHAVKAETLVLSSGRDQFLPSQEEAERLHRTLPKCEIRLFDECAHFLFWENGVDLVTIIKAASLYRRGKSLDYVSDFIPPTPSEFNKISGTYRLFDRAVSPVMLSTLENGKIVRGLEGIPLDGPVVLVGYHMLLGLELGPLVCRVFEERNVLLRGIAHPMMFMRLREGLLPSLSSFDSYRLMGAVPVSATNFYKLLSSRSHVLLYPGGMREALHRKGEEYRLFWPEQSEFVRMAARFGAKILPFGVVGEDDIGEMVLDYDDLVKIPFFKDRIEGLTAETVKLRSDFNGEVANQAVHMPGILPKLPGRFYYLFGKPIETEGRKKELKDREKAHELYLHIQSQVESCMAYLKEKRENDPYRSLLTRMVYQATHDSTAEVPTFPLCDSDN